MYSTNDVIPIPLVYKEEEGGSPSSFKCISSVGSVGVKRERKKGHSVGFLYYIFTSGVDQHLERRLDSFFSSPLLFPFFLKTVSTDLLT